MPKSTTTKIAALMKAKSTDTTVVDSSDDEKSSASDSAYESTIEPSVSHSSYASDDLDRDFSKINFLSDSEPESGNESDDEEENVAPEKTYKKRLIIGDGDFSYSAALITRHAHEHPGLASAITVSDLRTQAELKESYEEKFTEHANIVRQHGATLLFGVDGTELHTHEKLANHYPRIHFNFPHDGSNFKQQTLPEILMNFFASAKELQQNGDRIHMALPKLIDSQKNQFYKGYVYNIYSCAAENGYRHIIKRPFGSDRYPGYQHVITTRNDNADVAENAREYIFEKTNLTANEIHNAHKTDNNIKRGYGTFTFYKQQRKCLVEIDTDSNSSDYENDTPQLN